MKISNSKKQLAKIIHENGGWRDWANFAAQDKDGEVFGFGKKPVLGANREVWAPAGHTGILCTGPTIRGRHQTILSRDEYFYLYPAPDADGWIEWRGGECPVDVGAVVDVKLNAGAKISGFAGGFSWRNEWEYSNIIAYRLHKPDADAVDAELTPEPETKPTIEQLAADYHGKLAIAKQAREEADAHRCGAEVALSLLEIACKEIGFSVKPIEQPVDLAWNIGDKCVVVKSSDNADREGLACELIGIDSEDGELPYKVAREDGLVHWVDSIRRPAKEAPDA